MRAGLYEREVSNYYHFFFFYFSHQLLYMKLEIDRMTYILALTAAGIIALGVSLMCSVPDMFGSLLIAANQSLIYNELHIAHNREISIETGRGFFFRFVMLLCIYLLMAPTTSHIARKATKPMKKPLSVLVL